MQSAVTVKETSPISDLAAHVAITATGIALAALLSLHVLSPEYSPAWRMVSEYADGHYSWVLSLMFVAYGVGVLALAYSMRPRLHTRRGRVGLALLTLSGIGATSASLFDLHQVALHELGGILGIICLPIAAVLLTPLVAESPGGSASKNRLLVAANLTWVATFAHELGGNLPTTPPAELPAGVVALVGWTNRLFMLSAWAWVSAVAWQAIKSE